MKVEENLLIVKNLSFTYDDIPVLRRISFSLAAGETLVIAGESGSGKSTLLKLIGGHLDAGKGNIRYRGEELRGPSGNLIPGHPDILLMDQDFRMMPYLSVEDNLKSGILHLSESGRRRKLRAIRQKLGLKGLEGRNASDTSGGQRQRTALGQAMLGEAGLLLLDEPFSNLDYPRKWEILQDLKQQKKAAMIIITHDPADMMQLADRLIILKKGRLVQMGSPQTIYREPLNAYVAGLLGPANILREAEAKRLGLSGGSEVLIRPEDLMLDPGGFSAKLRSSHFLGPHYLLDIQLEGLQLQMYAKELPLTEFGVSIRKFHLLK